MNEREDTEHRRSSFLATAVAHTPRRGPGNARHKEQWEALEIDEALNL